jgi:flavin-dependent dehydrogenase
LVEQASIECDVAIIGGGPAGTTAACLLRKYNPKLRVLILEKEKFPREHIGESQLPTIGPILHEMGVWDKVEAAGFPVKIGASYTWGRNHDRWNFDFIPVETWTDPPRPGKYAGQRQQTAFQVDRAIYDNILLRHAEELGCQVREQTQVRQVLHANDHIDALRIETADGQSETITARHYIDASGSVSLVRKALDIPTWSPTELKNVAFYDYWENADWAVEIGSGATRIQIRSLPYGWIWFIPIGPTRTSIGLVAPVGWYKESGQTPEDLYRKAIAEQPEIAELTKNARPEGLFQTCRDWSNLADRVVGDNWFLAGESAGFADPILSAGMTLAHTSAREAAYTILELDRAELDPDWARERYDSRIRDGIRNHIRFAQYWYAANSCFTDLKDNCASIAKEAGVGLSPEKAWRWLSLGGFTNENVGEASYGSFGVTHTRRLVELFDGEDRKCASLAGGFNVFKLALKNAKRDHIGELENGRIRQIECYRRADRMLPNAGVFGQMLAWLGETEDAKTLSELMAQHARSAYHPSQAAAFSAGCWEALEVMVQDGWVLRSTNKKRPMLRLSHEGSRTIRSRDEEVAALEGTPNAPRVVDRLAPGEAGE